MASSAPWRLRDGRIHGPRLLLAPGDAAGALDADDLEAERFDQATYADPAKGLLHYQNRLKKAVRLVKFPRSRSLGARSKYRAIVSPPPPRKGRKKRKIQWIPWRLLGRSEGKWKAL